MTSESRRSQGAEEKAKVLQAFVSVARQFEREAGRCGFPELALLLGTTRLSAEELLTSLSAAGRTGGAAAP